MKPQPLTGGRPGIARAGDVVRRPAGFWTPQTQRLLRHLRDVGFERAPEPMGFEIDGCELVGYLRGEVHVDVRTGSARSLEALDSAARLLREYHDASESFAASPDAEGPWRLTPREPREVICHGDFAPYNVVFEGERATGLIDFDAAHPGPRVWDIAYALYRWAPFEDPSRPGIGGDLAAQVARARGFCDAYGLPTERRRELPAAMEARLRSLVAFMIEQAQQGDAAFAANLEDGHHLGYIADAEYIRRNASAIEAGIADPNENVASRTQRA